MTWATGLTGFAAGLLLSVVATPVGVSGAVFLLPVQLSVLGVPSPAVTPTNLLFNVVAGPGALLRYRRAGRGGGVLTRWLLAGTLPGVVAGAAIRVFAVPGPRVFRLVVAALLLPLGLWLCLGRPRPRPAPAADPAGAGQEPHDVAGAGSGTSPHPDAAGARPGPGASGGAAVGPSRRVVTSFAVVAGVVGGVYGIGGGSLLGPLLVGRGLPVGRVAPAALAATFATSIVGAATYALLGLAVDDAAAPDWPLGLLCGLGGLIGGYCGARLQPRLPERALRALLGALAVALATLYAVQALG
ncbi:hypothetical protein GCM10010123_43140 [Pilimelia anulata]|uniref:Probable membrane transporter protein n=1 Tax=Pilimelia anulata TaxID=53371 RepID=A0A8J3FCJ7_9ACTN|nr:TSUP family transporter [Pilimelia anulata]GGK08625.1 hypothetical protein GCM10010123_43140 [Pilimelia anulata]